MAFSFCLFAGSLFSGSQLFLIFFICFSVLKETAEYFFHTFHEMSVDHFRHTLCHFHADRPMRHLCNPSERHIINKQDIQIRFSLILTFLFQVCENLVDNTSGRSRHSFPVHRSTFHPGSVASEVLQILHPVHL